MRSISRRDLLRSGAAGAAALCLARRPGLSAAFADEKKIPIGLQLYSVREDAARDLAGVLKAVAEMGYHGVEFAGYYGHSAQDIRKMLDDVGLVCCGTHTGMGTILGDALPATIEFNQILGNKYLIVPGLGGEYTSSRAGWERAVREFTEAADRARPEGMLVGFHNHAIEFRPLDDGTLPWDLIFSNTPDDFVQQIDTGNAIHGGVNPVDFIRKYPGQTTTVHLKEHGGAFGEGNVPWEEVFEACETVGGTEWYIVEQEEYDKPPLECVADCIEVLREMGKL